MTEQPELNDDFVDMLRAFVKARVEFVIVGAHALAAHGQPRATGDLDLLIEPNARNAERVLEALRDFGAPVAAHGIFAADFERPNNVYQIGLPPRRIDLLTSITGVSFEEARSTRIIVTLEGMSLPVLGREALIKNKRATGRPKDIVDADVLEAAVR